MRKSIDVITQRILAIALLIFASGYFVSSFTGNAVKADGPSTVNTTGKIMMSESGFILNGNPMYHVLVWDTETGKSKLFFFKTGSTSLQTTSYQLPSSPLY